jgi:hypothetical protein
MVRNLNDLQFFAAVVQYRDLSAGARVLGLPKLRADRRLATLEQRLGVRLCSIIRRTVSTRRFSTAFAGDWPVSVWNARLNWRGLKCVASTTVSGVWRLPPVTAQTVASEREVGGGIS